MKRAIGRFFAWVGGIVVIGALVVIALAIAKGVSKKGVPARTILELDLEAGVVENLPDDPLAKLAAKDKAKLRDLTAALEQAGNDTHVLGLIARIGASKVGMAQIQEIRDAVQRFRQKGKFAIAYAETFGEFSQGGPAYYLATAFEQIWLQPSGDVCLTGLMGQGVFLRGTLDKLNIVPRMDHRKEYKNAMNMFTEKKFSAAHKEAMEKLLNGWYGQMVRGIAEGRHLSEGDVRNTIDRGPLLGKEAVDAKLVDQLGYRADVYATIKERAGKDSSLLYLSKYLERAGHPHKKKGKTLALIYGVGGVTRGRNDYDAMSGGSSMGSDTVTAAFRGAIDDKEVKAIVFRVDSPGGSYVASDAIWKEVVRAREANKPVIVSMGNVAGSGGYFVAMAADKIVAQPATITGSIGVLGGKLLTNEFFDKWLGVTFDEVHQGQNATFWSTTQDYTPAEWARFQSWLDRVYDDFTTKVAQGRKLPKERVLEIAKGRIWSGEDAKGLGLIDELGGLDVAVKLAKQAAGIGESEEYKLQLFPPPKSPLRAILDKVTGKEPESSEKDPGTAALVRALETMQPVVRAAQRAGIYGETGVLSVPLVPEY